MKDQEVAKDLFLAVVGPFKHQIGDLGISPLTIFFQLIQQMTLLKPTQALVATSHEEDSLSGNPDNSTCFDLSTLAQTDLVQADRSLGICGLPLYDFSEAEPEAMNSGASVEVIREILLARGILQFFYPPPDSTVLSLVDRGIYKPSEVAAHLSVARRLGHPTGNMELLPPETNFLDLIEAIKEQGYVIEGELGLELSEPGKTTRGAIKFRPREGLISKLINRISANLNLTLTPTP